MRFTLTLICAWLVLIAFFVSISPRFLPLSEPNLGFGTQFYLRNPHLAFRANFDGTHYLLIAANGYGFAQQAFFPFYPLVINLAGVVFSDRLLSAIIVSNLALIIAIVLMRLLVKLEFSESISRWTAILFLLFPASFFLTSVYTESLFIMLVLASMYLYRKNNFTLAALFGALASYTRLAGVFLIPAFILDMFYRRTFRPAACLTILLIGAGLGLYVFQSWQSTGDPLIFMTVQRHFGQDRSENLVLLPQVFWRYGKIIATMNRLQTQYLTVLFEFFSAVTFFIACVIGLKKVPLYVSVFSLLAYLLPTLTGTFVSLPRYVLACPSAFIVFALLMHRQRRLAKITLTLSLSCLLFVFTVLFIRGYWVA